MSTPDNTTDQSKPEPQHDNPAPAQNPDYQPGIEVSEVHAAIVREKQDPQDGHEPIPLWLISFFILLGFWSGGYLMEYSGGFRGDVFNHQQKSWVPVAAGAAKQVDPVARGKKLYTINCVTCHQATGQGLPGTYPPLVGSEIVLSKDGWGQNHLAKIVLNGLTGPIKVAGSVYNGAMPAWKDQLKDDQIAYILTYIRQEWGNAAGPVTPETIAAIRAKHGTRAQNWTEAELKAIPAQ